MLRFCSKFAQSACRTVLAGVSTAGRSYVGAAYAQATTMPSPTNSRVAAAAGIAAASAVTIFGRFLILLLWLGICSRPACGISSPEVRPQQESEREPMCPGLMGTATASTLPMERSFIMIKPDGVQRGLVSEIVGRFESRGYKLVGMKLMTPSTELAGKHYAEHEGRPFYPKLVDFLSSGPVVAMVWEGKDVIKTGRAMIGSTNPLASNPGTIRGDLGIDVGRNIIHGSDSVESAQREIALWFSPDELSNYQLLTHSMIYE